MSNFYLVENLNQPNNLTIVTSKKILKMSSFYLILFNLILFNYVLILSIFFSPNENQEFAVQILEQIFSFNNTYRSKLVTVRCYQYTVTFYPHYLHYHCQIYQKPENVLPYQVSRQQHTNKVKLQHLFTISIMSQELSDKEIINAFDKLKITPETESSSKENKNNG